MSIARTPRTSSGPSIPQAATAAEVKAVLEARRRGDPFLCYRLADGELRLLELRRREPLTIGRRDSMDVALCWDPQVSGVHAELRCLGGEWTVVDGGLSTNGTFVNGSRVSGNQRLHDGDCIRIGQTLLTYNGASAVATTKTATPGDLPAVAHLTMAQRRVLISLCRPYKQGAAYALPAANQQIAAELFLSVDAVKMHLRTLYGRFELNHLPQNEKRVRLAECVLELGLLSARDL